MGQRTGRDSFPLAVHQSIGHRIQALRLTRGLSVRAFAAVIHRAPTTVKRWEQGSTELRMRDFAQLCLTFRVRFLSLTGDLDHALGRD